MTIYRSITSLIIFLTVHLLVAQERFEIEGNGDQYIRIESLNGGDTGIDFIRSLSIRPNWRLINDSSPGDFIFYVNKIDDFQTIGQEVLRLTDNELIGISNANPLSKLHIENGTIADLSNHGSLLIGDITGANLVFDEDEILARHNGAAGKLLIQPHGGHTLLQSGGGNVGVGHSALAIPDSKFHVLNGQKANLVEHGFALLGSPTNANMVFDENDIQARNNSNATDLFVQNSGGNLGVNESQGQLPVSSLQIFEGQDVGPIGNNGLFMVGRENDSHLVMDMDDIQTRSGADPTGLNLNRFGSNVGIGVLNALPLAKLHIEGGDEASLFMNGFVMMGKPGGPNLVLDNEKMQSRDNGATAPLTIQPVGGNVVITPLGTNNRVGIGTTLPEEKLHVQSTDWQALFQHQNNSNKWYIGASDSDWAVAQDDLFVISSTGVSSTGLLFLDGGTQSVGIGTHVIPAGYKVAIEGNVVCEEVLVSLEMDWPDYVFDAEYDLMSLDQLEKEIRKLGHLPGMPSAEEVKSEGVSLGDMNARLLKNIEELTLHVIQLQKQNDAITIQLKDLQSQKGENRK